MIKANASVQVVLAELRSGIQMGRYAPGQRLITSELAEHLKTSLAPVREALHILIGEGLVEMHPNRGARVRALNTQTFIDGLQVLEVIGALALQLIGPKLKKPKIRADIEQALKAIYEGGRRRNVHAFFGAIADSHRLVNDYCGNAYLNPILNRIHLEYFYRQMADLLPDDFWEQYIENYRRTGGLLVSGDAAGAERAWRKHVQWVIGLIARHGNAGADQ
jgi:DNA-binding GntR family transcriptional regulator